MKDGKMIIASGTLPVTFSLDNMLKVGLIKLREGESMDQHDMVVNKQREILDALEPETLKEMIFDLWAALHDEEDRVAGLAMDLLNMNAEKNNQSDTIRKHDEVYSQQVAQIRELKAEIAGLHNQILDTGPMLPKNGITISYT